MSLVSYKCKIRVRKRTDVLVAPETVFRIVFRLHFTKLL